MRGPVRTTSREGEAPTKSGTGSSKVTAGRTVHTCWAVLAKWEAPPSGRSSHVTDVRTRCLRPGRAVARMAPAGSRVSGGPGLPFPMAQNRHRHVHNLPRMRKVAVRREKRVPRFAHAASAQIVAAPVSWGTATARAKAAGTTRTLAHGGSLGRTGPIPSDEAVDEPITQPGTLSLPRRSVPPALPADSGRSARRRLVGPPRPRLPPWPEQEARRRPVRPR